MTLKTLAAAACLSLVSATASFAAPVKYDFSFTDGTNTITGLIEGLDSDGAGQQGSKVTVVGVFDTYFFTSFSFSSIDVISGDVDPSSITFSATDTTDTAAFDIFFGIGFLKEKPNFFTTAEFTGTTTPVPLPASALLFLSGLAGLAGLKRRKNRSA